MLFVKDRYGIQWNIRPSQSKKVLFDLNFFSHFLRSAISRGKDQFGIQWNIRHLSEFSLKFQRLKDINIRKLECATSEPPRKDGNARFRTVFLKALSDQVILVSMFIISKFENGYFLFWFLY